MFRNIKDIKIGNNSSWKGKIFLTFDTDWCSDEVLSYALNIIDKHDIKATFFVTHETKLLERMREKSNIELGIHPNFNPLLNGSFRYGKNVDEVIDYYKKIIPEAESVRSHSVTQSSPILESFARHGLKFDCNTFIPFSSNIDLEPYYHWTDNLVKVPYFWEDDIHCIYNWKWRTEEFLKGSGMKVFDFHPIHLFLNTEDINRYEKSKESHRDMKRLKNYVNKEIFGTYNFLIDIIEREVK